MVLFDLVPFLCNWISLSCFHNLKVVSWFSSLSLVIKEWKCAHFSSFSGRNICVSDCLRVLGWERRDSSTVKVTALLLEYLWWVGTFNVLSLKWGMTRLSMWSLDQHFMEHLLTFYLRFLLNEYCHYWSFSYFWLYMIFYSYIFCIFICRWRVFSQRLEASNMRHD